MDDFIAVYPVADKKAAQKPQPQEPLFLSTQYLFAISDLHNGLCAIDSLELSGTLTISAKFDAIAAAFAKRQIPTFTLRGKVGNPHLEMSHVLLLPANYNAPQPNGDGYTCLSPRPTAAFGLRRRGLTIYTFARVPELQEQINVALSIADQRAAHASHFTDRLMQTRTVHLPPFYSQQN